MLILHNITTDDDTKKDPPLNEPYSFFTLILSFSPFSRDIRELFLINI